jgi:hypothetical protein
MSARPLPQVDDTIYTVSLWKDELDSTYKWWQKAFYRFLYLPFNEFSLKVIKIPKATEIEREGDKVRFRIWEIIGHYGSPDEADITCTTPRHCYKDYPYGRRFPDISGQIGHGPVFPRAKDPRKRIQPIMDTTFLPRREVSQMRNEIARLNQVLDQ